MRDLFGQLGVNWRLLISQGVNFFVLLVVLSILVYRPLMRVLEERRRKVAEGLRSAEAANQRLKEIETLETEKLAHAEQAGLALIREAEKEAGARGQGIIADSQRKAEVILTDAGKVAERRKTEAREAIEHEAHALIASAIAQAVQLDPKKIDDELIGRAVKLLKSQRA